MVHSSCLTCASEKTYAYTLKNMPLGGKNLEHSGNSAHTTESGTTHHNKTPATEPPIKPRPKSPQRHWKETPTQASREYCKTAKNIYSQQWLPPPPEAPHTRNSSISTMRKLQPAHQKTLHGCSLSIFQPQLHFGLRNILLEYSVYLVFIAQISHYENSRHCIN